MGNTYAKQNSGLIFHLMMLILSIVTLDLAYKLPPTHISHHTTRSPCPPPSHPPHIHTQTVNHKYHHISCIHIFIDYSDHFPLYICHIMDISALHQYFSLTFTTKISVYVLSPSLSHTYDMYVYRNYFLCQFV